MPQGASIFTSAERADLKGCHATLCEYDHEFCSLRTNRDTSCPKNMQGARLGLGFSIFEVRGGGGSCSMFLTERDTLVPDFRWFVVMVSRSSEGCRKLFSFQILSVLGESKEKA